MQNDYPAMWDFFINQYKITSITPAPGGNVPEPCTTGNDLLWCDDFECCSQLHVAEYAYIMLISKLEDSHLISLLAKCGYDLDAKATRMTRLVALVGNSSGPYFKNGFVFVKSKEITRKPNAVITWASGIDFCHQPGFKAFVNSLKCVDADKIVFTHDMDIETREWLDSKEIQIVDVDPKEFEWVLRDRFLAWYKFLDKNLYKYVALVDSKDVVFQADPFYGYEYMVPLIFIGEGKKHYECDWNLNDQHKFQQQLRIFKEEDYKNWEVVCGGTIFGIAENIKSLIIQIWSTTLLSNNSSTDQATLNFLYHTIYKDSYLGDPRTCTLVVTADLPKDPKPIIKDGIIYHSTWKSPYYVVHQYDRVPEFKDEILKKYSE